ncbi:uncharacterized protein LOC111905928 isoform X1 [Lactuca sativa]|uniref:uncharacterized protein LOC111905928 isoform X1 n=1 Tax=Lactuca sativa TaxID=4236 RepID=UPI000CD80E52|nr:uncharacterized protein LOC111905928 isoform X1 [Lactuca sativa]
MDETLVTSSEPPPSDGDPMDVVTEPHNPNDNQSASSSDSDSESDDEAQAALELQTLETELSTNPANYDAHVQYIKALRKQGDIDKLRLAREAMSELFPLTPAMWQQWANDEISLTLTSGNEGAIPTVEKLYERGVSDYLSVSLWYDYLSFIQKYDSSVRECSPSGISKARDLFERALTACGLHVTEGCKIWEAYRSYEEMILDGMDKTDSELREKQVQRIRSIYHRQLSITHSDLKSTLLTYKTWESKHGNNLDVSSSNTDGLSPQVASTYQKALEMLTLRADFEEKIVKSDETDTERLQSFMAYLKFEQSSGDPIRFKSIYEPRVKSLYERAITEFPISSDLWIDYTNYLNKTLKADKTLRDIYDRATRNCPWVGELWVRYMLYLERCHGSEKELSDVFERSLQCTFSTIDEYVDIFLTRVDGLRRRITFAKELDNGLDFVLIRDTFQRASDYLSPQLKNSNTYSLLQIHSYWARLESSIGKDITAARGVWESLLKNSGSMIEAWKGYISMETEMAHIKEARSLYKRCYTMRFPGTGSEDICKSWILFEREFGSLEDFDHASQKVTPRLQELQLYKLQQETDEVEDPPTRNRREKRKAAASAAASNEHPPAKRQKDKANKVEKSVTQKDKDMAHGENEPKIKNPTPEKPKLYTDKCTAFVSNLNPKANEEELRGFFSDVGGAGEIRILKDKLTKKSRGLAYVDFCDDAHLEAAVAKNKQTFLGKKLTIVRSDPKGKRKVSFGDDRNSTKQGRGGDDTNSGEHGHKKVELKGKNTFAVPRNVRPLGWSFGNEPPSAATSTTEGGDEKPKSNQELRDMLLNKK